MGKTHFDQVVGVKGLFVGAAGSEVQQPVAITMDIGSASTASVTKYIAAPIAGNVTGYAAFAVSAGTGRAVSVRSGSAGDDLCITATTGVTGTIGAVVTMAASSGGNTCTAGQALSVFSASCATAQTALYATIIFSPSTA